MEGLVVNIVPLAGVLVVAISVATSVVTSVATSVTTSAATSAAALTPGTVPERVVRDLTSAEMADLKQFLATQTWAAQLDWASLKTRARQEKPGRKPHWGLIAEIDGQARLSGAVCRIHHYRSSKADATAQWQIDAPAWPFHAFVANQGSCKQREPGLLLDDKISDAMFSWIFKEQARIFHDSGPLIRGNGACLRMWACQFKLSSVRQARPEKGRAFLSLSYLPESSEQRDWCVGQSMRVEYRVEKYDLTPWATHCDSVTDDSGIR